MERSIPTSRLRLVRFWGSPGWREVDSAFLRMCAGLERPAAGRIEVGGGVLSGQPYRRFLDAGVHFIPAGRLEEGLIAGLSIAEHLELVGDHRSFMVDRERAADVAQGRIAEFSIKGSPATHADTLSGGNQQRLLMAMAPDDPTLLLMEHPTRGLDLGSAEWVWDRLLRSRTGGQRSSSHRPTSRSCCDTAIASPCSSRVASSPSCLLSVRHPPRWVCSSVG